MKKRLIAFVLLVILALFAGVSMGEERQEGQTVIDSMPHIIPGQLASEKRVYIDSAGDMVIVPKDFAVSVHADEQTINTGVVVIGPDGSEFVWVPTTSTGLARRDFGSYVSWGADPADY